MVECFANKPNCSSNKTLFCVKYFFKRVYTSFSNIFKTGDRIGIGG